MPNPTIQSELELFKKTGNSTHARWVANELLKAQADSKFANIEKQLEVTVGHASGGDIKSGLLWAVLDLATAGERKLRDELEKERARNHQLNIRLKGVAREITRSDFEIKAEAVRDYEASLSSFPYTAEQYITELLPNQVMRKLDINSEKGNGLETREQYDLRMIKDHGLDLPVLGKMPIINLWEGDELEERKKPATGIMLHGVLNMPPELWGSDQLDQAQRHSKYIEASEILNNQAKQIVIMKKTLMEIRNRCRHWPAAGEMAANALDKAKSVNQ